MVTWLIDHGELLSRVTITVVLVFAPAAVFVMFWRVLHRLRDDRLIERVTEDRGTEPPFSALASPGSLSRDETVERSDGNAHEPESSVMAIDGTEPAIRCPVCEGTTPAGDAFCWRCGEWIGEE